jgi:hypothetical protein
MTNDERVRMFQLELRAATTTQQIEQIHERILAFEAEVRAEMTASIEASLRMFAAENDDQRRRQRVRAVTFLQERGASDEEVDELVGQWEREVKEINVRHLAELRAKLTLA